MIGLVEVVDADALHDRVGQELGGEGRGGWDHSGDCSGDEQREGGRRAGVPHQSEDAWQGGGRAGDRLLEVEPSAPKVLRAFLYRGQLRLGVPGQAAVGWT